MTDDGRRFKNWEKPPRSDDLTAYCPMICDACGHKPYYPSPDIAAEFVKISVILGLKEQEAAELALSEWAKKHQDESQKKLNLYAERGITIIEPQTVNIVVFQKAEILPAKEELRRVIENCERGNPEYRHELQLEMAKALKWIQPIYNKTKDSELLRLSQFVEGHLN